MKKILFLILLIGSCFHSNAQDILIQKNGDELKVKVQEVTTSEIKYKKFDNLNGPIYTLPKSEVFMIKYENGTKDVFNNSDNSNSSSNENTTSKEAAIKVASDYIAGIISKESGGILNLKGSTTNKLHRNLIEKCAEMPAIANPQTVSGNCKRQQTNKIMWRLATTQKNGATPKSHTRRKIKIK